MSWIAAEWRARTQSMDLGVCYAVRRTGRDSGRRAMKAKMLIRIWVFGAACDI
jgi:hypothetical protein